MEPETDKDKNHSFQLYRIRNNLEYQRINELYTPTYPCFSYGIAFTCECDKGRTPYGNGPEGAWTLTANGSTVTLTVTSDKNFLFDQTVFVGDSSAVNGTNLSLSSNTYGR